MPLSVLAQEAGFGAAPKAQSQRESVLCLAEWSRQEPIQFCGAHHLINATFMVSFTIRQTTIA